MVPEGWMGTTLGSLYEFKNGFNTDKSNYGYGLPFVNVSEVLAHEYLTEPMIPGKVNVTPKEAEANSVLYGDLLFNRTSETADEVGLTSVYLGEGDVVFGGFVIRGRPVDQTVYPPFSKYAMRQPMVRKEIIRRGQGAIRSNISQGDLSKVPVNIPPLPEQRKIAEILSTWDRAIEVSEALLTTARTQKRSLMQSLLTGKHRLPEFEGQPWKEVRLGDVGETISGGTPSSTAPEYWNGDVHWATPTDITKLKSRFIKSTARMITQAGLKSSSAKLVPAGSILICTRATIGEMAIATGPISTNQGFKNLVLNDGFDGEFIFYLLQFFKNDLIRYACGSTFLELSKADFVKRSFMMPELSEQKRIAGVINAAEAEIEIHQQDIEILRTEKRALMQQLLTGKRRVVV